MTSINVMPNNMPQISDKICKRAHADISTPHYSHFSCTQCFCQKGNSTMTIQVNSTIIERV